MHMKELQASFAYASAAPPISHLVLQYSECLASSAMLQSVLIVLSRPKTALFLTELQRKHKISYMFA